MDPIEWPKRELGVALGAWSGPMVDGKLVEAAKAGKLDPLTWISVEAPDLDLKFQTTIDNVSTNGKRLGVSYNETVEVLKALGRDLMPATKRLVDAIYVSAPIKTAFHSLVTAKDPDSGGVKMRSQEFADKYNADVDAQIRSAGGTPRESFHAGADKYWILHPRQAEMVEGLQAAINYGGHAANGKPQQSVGGRHHVEHGDYSQLLRPVRRYAEKISDGSKVDLLTWAEREEKVPARFTEVFK